MPNNFLEKTLEEIIFENKTTIHTKGLEKLKSTTFRQVVLPSGKRIDILSFELVNGYLNFDIYELKKDYINIEAISQAYNYLVEIRQLISGNFKGYNASIIMVGSRYDHIPILDGMSVPVKVYTYNYGMDGITFSKVDLSVPYHSPNEHFSLGLMAWGLDMLTYTQGAPTTMNFHSSILRHLDGGNFEKLLRSEQFKYYKDLKLLPAHIELKIEKEIITETVKTIIFPEQPSWSTEFAADIPPSNDLMEDIEIDEDVDYEEEQDNDLSDFEVDFDNEDDEIQDLNESEFNKSLFINGLTIEPLKKQNNNEIRRKAY